MRRQDTETPDIFWVQDSGGLESCHINDGSTFEQSFIGALHDRGESGWHVILKDGTDITPEEGCSTYSRARNLMEAYYRRDKNNTKNAIAVPDRNTPRAAQRGKV